MFFKIKIRHKVFASSIIFIFVFTVFLVFCLNNPVYSLETKSNQYGEILFHDSWLEQDTLKYNNDLSLFCANVNNKIEENPDSINNYLEESAFNDCYVNSSNHLFSETLMYSIAHKCVQVNSEKKELVCVTCRGSRHLYEALACLGRGASIDYAGAEIYADVYEFVDSVKKGLVYYGENIIASSDSNKKLCELDSDKLVFVVSGHSLGGAVANALAAEMDLYAGDNSVWFQKALKQNIYAYTFAAIKTLGDSFNDEDMLEEGYENIHNLYNWSDSYGPCGSKQYMHVSVPAKKFGHLETFDIDKHDSWWILASDSHNMSTYLEAVHEEQKNPGYIQLGCSH